MNFVDLMVLFLLACGDVCLLAYLRRRHARNVRLDRMSRSLELHLRRETAPEAIVAPRKRQFRYQ